MSLGGGSEGPKQSSRAVDGADGGSRTQEKERRMGKVRYTGERQLLLQPILDGRKDGTRGVTGGRVHMWLADVRIGPLDSQKRVLFGDVLEIGAKTGRRWRGARAAAL